MKEIEKVNAIIVTSLNGILLLVIVICLFNPGAAGDFLRIIFEHLNKKP